MADVRTEGMPRRRVAFCEAIIFESHADRMIFRVGVSRVGRDDVANPTQRAAGTDPEAGRNDQPENPRQDAAIVKLANSGN